MAIPLEKDVCGNCKLRRADGKCAVDDSFVGEMRLGCMHIGTNFEDRGFVNPSMKQQCEHLDEAIAEGARIGKESRERGGMKMTGEAGARNKCMKAIEEADRQFSRETHEAWEKYSAAWRPLKEKWESVSRPALKKRNQAVIQAERVLKEELEELREKQREAKDG